jgi:hypothetical protein
MFFALHDLLTTKIILFVGSFTSCGYLSCATSTCGLLLCWLTNKFSSFYSLSAAVPADEHLSVFLFLTSSILILLGFGSGLTIIKFQHSSKPYRYAICSLRGSLPG